RAITLVEADTSGSPKLTAGYVNLGALLADTGRYQEAESAYRRVLEIGQKVPDDLARRPDHRSLLGAALRGLAQVLVATGGRGARGGAGPPPTAGPCGSRTLGRPGPRPPPPRGFLGGGPKPPGAPG